MISAPARRGRERTTAALALASGAVFAASTPPIDLTAGILVGLVGFAISLGDDERSALRGWLFGVGANVVAAPAIHGSACAIASSTSAKQPTA